jgi:hypothetical protein
MTRARRRGLGGGQPHAVVVVHVLDGDLGALLQDVLVADAHGALGMRTTALLASCRAAHATRGRGCRRWRLKKVAWPNSASA